MIVFIIYFLFTIIITIFGLYQSYTFKKVIGISGLQGDQGPKGPDGDNGLIGYSGYKGIEGPRGPPGKPGGRRGIKGPKGPPGDIGPKGLRGFRGFKGEKGFQGERGIKGMQGQNGQPGKEGSIGDPGEYLFTEIDYEKCSLHTFSKDREMKCADNRVLTEINNDVNNYYGKCCELKMSDKCKNEITTSKWGIKKNMTEKEIELYDKYVKIYPLTHPLYFKYDCEPDYIGKPQGTRGNSFRCCLKEENNLDTYNKNY